jgi:hypothetical protein
LLNVVAAGCSMERQHSSVSGSGSSSGRYDGSATVTYAGVGAMTAVFSLTLVVLLERRSIE